MSSAYSPLPQSNSDSEESSEELHSYEKTRVVNRTSRSQNASPEKMFNGSNQNSTNYKLVHGDGENMEVTLITFQSTSDEVSILKPNNKIEIFSTSRKICFLLSILVCILTTVVFIWFLPCYEATCLSPSKVGPVTWEHTLDNLELYGPIGVNNKSLVFLTRKLLNSDGGGDGYDVPTEKTNKNRNIKFGLIAFDGKTGLERWNISLNEEPKDLNCNMIDVNLDGTRDCLVWSTHLLMVIDSLTGEKIWDFEKLKKKFLPSYEIDFPIAIYDVNEDSVNDLITSCALKKAKKFPHADHTDSNFLIVISGKTGDIINVPMRIPGCSTVHNLTMETNALLSFTCVEDISEQAVFKTLNMQELLATLEDYPNNKLIHSKWENSYEHPQQSNSVFLKRYGVIVDNRGRCPQSCSVSVDIRDCSRNQTVYTYNETNSYCVLPTIFEGVSSNFIVLKFWKWKPKDSLTSEKNDGKLSVKRAVTLQEGREKELKNLEGLYNVMLSESEYGSKRFKRGLEKAVPGKITFSGVYMHVIMESIVIVTFNSTGHPSVTNIAENKLLQSCKVYACQPDVYRQTRSLLTADLNGDGDAELVSFSSQYVHDDGPNQKMESWRLQSRIKVFTLQ